MFESLHDGPEPIGEIMARYDFSVLEGNNPERDSSLVQDTAADDEIGHLLEERQSLRNVENADRRQQGAAENGHALIEAYMRRLDPNYKQK